jgi:heme/copper-type cytochrome/quinol oxidase subunit 2
MAPALRPNPSRTRILRRSLAAALLVAAFAAVPAQASVFGPPKAHSPNAEDIRTTYWVMFVVVGIIALVAIGAVIAAALRFQERREEPRRLSAGRGAVAKVGLGLGLVAVAIFVFGVVMTDSARQVESSGPDGLQAQTTTFAQVGADGVAPLTESQVQDLEDAAGQDTSAKANDTTSTGPLQISAISQQWLWRFEYPGGRQGQRTFSYGELVVPVDTAVVLNITSTDVIHSWFVPALGGQVDAVPGKVSQTWFKADKTGVFHGNSTMFSGTAYPAMRADVRVVSVAEYQDFLDQQQKDLAAGQQAVVKEQAQQSPDAIESGAQ